MAWLDCRATDNPNSHQPRKLLPVELLERELTGARGQQERRGERPNEAPEGALSLQGRSPPSGGPCASPSWFLPSTPPSPLCHFRDQRRPQEFLKSNSGAW